MTAHQRRTPTLTTVRPRRISRYGWRPSLPDQRDRVFHAPRGVTVSLPAVHSLRAACPPVYDQLDLGSCVPNAVASAYQMEAMKLGRGSEKPSRLFLYYNGRAIEGSVAEDSGTYVRDVFKAAAHDGCPSERLWRYDTRRFTEQPPASVYKTGQQHQALQYLRVRQTPAQIKACLFAGFAVVFGFTVYESFESPEVARTGMVPMPAADEKDVGGHGVKIVGYDDPRGLYEVKNSWGHRWGDGGYFWIPQAYVHDPNLAADFWTLRVVEG